MEENNKKFQGLKSQLDEMQKIYNTDLERGKDEVNDQIQENRKKRINQLQEEIKEIEIEKLNNLEERKVEIEKILKKRDSLNKDKEQLEQVIYEMSGENEIQDGKLVKTKEQVEYEKNLEKVNSELDSLKIYDKELSEVNFEIQEISDKYGFNKIYEENNIKISEDIIISLDEITEDNIEVKGNKLYCYQYQYGDELNKYIYTDNEILFDSINTDKEYAKELQNFLHPDRIIKYLKEAEKKGTINSAYIGNIRRDLQEDKWKKARHFGESENLIYDEISKKEYEKLLNPESITSGYIPQEVSSEEQKKGNFSNEQLEENKKVKLDLFSEQQKREEINILNYNNEFQEKKDNTKDSKDINYKQTNSKINSENGQNFNKYSELYNKDKSLIEYKKPNRFITWIKEKITKNKTKIKLEESEQVWQDYIDELQGKISKKSRIIEFKDNLKVKGQQLKQSEIVANITKQNEIEQVDEERY